MSHTKESCPHCGIPMVWVKKMATGPHYAKKQCEACGRFICWVPMPDSLKRRRPAKHRDLVKKWSNGFCEMCGLREEDLRKPEVLESHHVMPFAKGGSNEKNNIWIVCSSCHSLIEHQRCYRGHYVAH